MRQPTKDFQRGYEPSKKKAEKVGLGEQGEQGYEQNRYAHEPDGESGGEVDNRYESNVASYARSDEESRETSYIGRGDPERRPTGLSESGRGDKREEATSAQATGQAHWSGKR